MLIYDEQGNQIGSYSPPHDGDRTEHLITAYPAMNTAIAEAIDKVLKTDENANVELSFKAKLKH